MLITPDYQRLQAQAHQDPNYGIAARSYAGLVSSLCEKHGIEDLLDYGAGKRRLFDGLKRPMMLHAYDPAIPEISTRPKPAQMVCCIDVLEHVEPDCLDAVLDDLRALTLKVAFVTVATGPAKRILPDGRNAHLITEPDTWWLPKLQRRWQLEVFQRVANGFATVLMV